MPCLIGFITKMEFNLQRETREKRAKREDFDLENGRVELMKDYLYIRFLKTEDLF